MGMKINFDPEALAAEIRQTGALCVDGVFEAMKEGAKDVAELAKSYAPVDSHSLEHAIRAEVQGGGKNQLGQFARKHMVIFVDSDYPGKNTNGEFIDKTVGEYAMLMHEGLAPYGSGFYSLGPRSAMKAASGNDVGGKFFERAIADSENAIFKKAFWMAKKALKEI